MAQIGIAHLTWKRYCQRGLLPFGITLKQCYVLRQLLRREVLYPAEVARMLFCDRPTATVILANMVRQGWIVRSRDPDDGKRVRIMITDAGRTLCAKIDQQSSTHTPFDPLACLTEDESYELHRILLKLNAHLRPLNEETEGG